MLGHLFVFRFFTAKCCVFRDLKSTVNSSQGLIQVLYSGVTPDGAQIIIMSARNGTGVDHM